MQLRAHGVGVVVTLSAVVINGPEHRAEHSRVAGRFAQLVGGACGCGARNDVLHRLHDNRRRGIRREEADRNLLWRHGREEVLRVAAYIEAVQQEFRHGCVVVHAARLVDFAIETLERRRVVVLHVDEGEYVADGVGNRQVRTELAAVAWVAGGDLRSLRHQADHELGAEVIVQLVQG